MLAFFQKRVVLITLGAIVGVIVFATLALYVGTEMRLAAAYDAPQIALKPPLAPSAQRGLHMATITGCVSCHEDNGNILFQVDGVGKLVSPNLTRVARLYTDEQLAVLLRTGIKHDGASAISMPADSQSHLSDQDVADIIAWMRSLKELPDAPTGETTWGPLGRIGVVMGRIPYSAEMPRASAPPLTQPTDILERGEYFANTACLHCHRLNEEHKPTPDTLAPPLRAAATAYDLTEFTHLMRTGLATGNREVGLMSEVSREALYDMSDEEIAALHAYLIKAED